MPDGFEDPSDADRPSLPLPPDDRLWRHPSEVGTAGGSTPSGRGRGPVVTTLVMGLGVVLVVVGAIAMVGWLDSDPPRTTTTAEPIETHVVLVATSTTTTTDGVHGPGFLGVYASDDAAGVRITRCMPDSPAAASLQSGDIIVAFDGTAVTKLAQLESMLQHSKPGSLAQIDIERRGTPQSVTIRLAESR